MPSSASLTNGLKTALYALTDLNKQIDTSNQRLATGKKVNSALDNALSFFTASGLNDRANTLSTLQDNLGLGINVHKQADKALTSQKNALENIEGQLRQALQSTGTQAKAVSNKSYASGTALVAGAVGNTDRAQFQVGDTFKVSIGTTDAAGTFTSTATQAAAFTFAAGTTVQQFVDQINNDAVLNGGANGQRVRAYINDSGNFAIEQSQAGNAPTGQSYALQLATTNGSGAGTVTNNLREVLGVSGDTNKSVGDVVTGTAPTETQTVTITSAQNTSRAAIATNFKELVQVQLGNLAKDAGYNGTNLLNGDSIRVQFNEDNTTSLTTKGVRFDASGYGFKADNTTNNTGDTVFNFQSDKEIRDALKTVTAAKTQLISQQGTFSNNFNILQNRNDYLKGTVTNLRDGADDLTNADINEEGAKLTSLQTRQQLSVQALSLANRSDQAILRLF